MKKVISLTIALCLSIVTTNKAFFDIQKILTSSSASAIFIRVGLKFIKDFTEGSKNNFLKTAKKGADQHLIQGVLIEKILGSRNKTQLTNYKGMEDSTIFTTTFVFMHKFFNKPIKTVMNLFQSTDGTSVVSNKCKKVLKNTILGTITAIACHLEREVLNAITPTTTSITSELSE
jgi:hypothetical protein